MVVVDLVGDTVLVLKVQMEQEVDMAVVALVLLIRGTEATSGVDHLGGGGAGDYPDDPGGTPGGSGIVIVRYQV